LLARREATIALRTALLLNDAQVSLELLKDVKLSITSTALDGVDTTSEVKIAKLDPAKVFTHTMVVPERVTGVSVTLTAQVEKLSQGGAKEALTQRETWRSMASIGRWIFGRRT